MAGIRRAFLLIAAVSGVNSVAGLAQKPEAARPGSAAPTETLPPNFRGRISYSGSHEATVTRAGPPLRSLRSRDILRSVTGGRSRQYEGTFNIELAFEGNSVSGRYSGSGGMGSGNLSGTRSGDHCRLFNDQDRTVTEAVCTRDRFSGEARSQRGNTSAAVRMEADATRFVNAVVEEREQRAAAAAVGGERAAVARPAERGTRAQLERLSTQDLTNRIRQLSRSQSALDDRISSASNPCENLAQNIPQRDELGSSIDAGFEILYERGVVTAAEMRQREANARAVESATRRLVEACN